jgi:erythromycin esterase-like protein
MTYPAPIYATLDEWISREVMSFTLDVPEALNAAVDRMVSAVGERVELLGFGEALHGGEEILVLRNRLFRRLVEGHGYRAIAVESSYPRGRVVNEYVVGRGDASYDDVREAGFSHGFGRLEANRELVEWMRGYNADASHGVKLHFYGFDMPGVVAGPASPREVLELVLDYLTAIDAATARAHRERIEPLLGRDGDWEDPMAWRDPARSAGLLSAATALRVETEELISTLRTRRPEWVAATDEGRYLDARHDAEVARQLLNFYAALARGGDYAASLGVRDALMADNLVHIVSRERGRGRVLAFAHNKHLQRGRAEWRVGPMACAWWPAGAHLGQAMGRRYAVVGSGVGVSAENGIGQPEAGSLEARLTAAPGPVRFVPTRAVADAAVAGLPTREGSARNPTYFALGAQSFTDFDGLVVLDSVTYNRGGRPLPPG